MCSNYKTNSRKRENICLALFYVQDRKKKPDEWRTTTLNLHSAYTTLSLSARVVSEASSIVVMLELDYQAKNSK